MYIYDIQYRMSEIEHFCFLPARLLVPFGATYSLISHFHRGGAEIRAQKKTSDASRRLSHLRVSSYRF